MSLILSNLPIFASPPLSPSPRKNPFIKSHLLSSFPRSPAFEKLLGSEVLQRLQTIKFLTHTYKINQTLLNLILTSFLSFLGLSSNSCTSTRISLPPACPLDCASFQDISDLLGSSFSRKVCRNSSTLSVFLQNP